MENFLLPDEIVLKILGYLGLDDLIQCAKVSKRFNTICKDKSLSYRSILLLMKDLNVENQKYMYNHLIRCPEFTKVVVLGVTWEDGTRLSEIMATKNFLGPKRYFLEKKKKVLKALGASVRVNHAIIDNYTLKIGLIYSLPTFKYKKWLMAKYIKV